MWSFYKKLFSLLGKQFPHEIHRFLGFLISQGNDAYAIKKKKQLSLGRNRIQGFTLSYFSKQNSFKKKLRKTNSQNTFPSPCPKIFIPSSPNLKKKVFFFYLSFQYLSEIDKLKQNQLKQTHIYVNSKQVIGDSMKNIKFWLRFVTCILLSLGTSLLVKRIKSFYLT